jgi:hypothetical protein
MRPADAEVITAYGTAVRDGYLLRERDVHEAILELKEEMRTLERLKGRVVIADRQVVITTYPTSCRKQRSLLRSCR